MCPPGWLGWRHIPGGTGPGPLPPAPGEGGGSIPSPSSLPREQGASPFPGKCGCRENHPGRTHIPTISDTGSGSLPSKRRERCYMPPPKQRRKCGKLSAPLPPQQHRSRYEAQPRQGDHGCGWKALAFPRSRDIIRFSFSRDFISATGKRWEVEAKGNNSCLLSSWENNPAMMFPRAGQADLGAGNRKKAGKLGQNCGASLQTRSPPRRSWDPQKSVASSTGTCGA